MEHEYQLVRPAFDTIVDYCNDLEANEKLIVFEFGWNCDLVLHIYKDVVDEISATEVIVKHTDGLSRLELHKFTDPNSNRYAYRYVYYISK